MTDKENYKQK